ncbi:response regulator [Geomonas propionica]|uniref:Response regulator n=1 Tax=Geomonas propionica TaxID=2798582 RepID=A0ABS0YLF8_9BACT|nr:response regulator [Geomonas propionica]MBJ6798784.1 response regulator [Geomonas propionica]
MKNRCKMVIIEDDALSLQILASVLERKFRNVEVFTASNGREGLKIFNEQLPELVLTDIKMPEMDGVQLARIVRESHPETIIIMISADSGDASFSETVNSGLNIDYFVPKPVDYDKLFTAIEEALAKVC